MVTRYRLHNNPMGVGIPADSHYVIWSADSCVDFVDLSRIFIFIVLCRRSVFIKWTFVNFFIILEVCYKNSPIGLLRFPFRNFCS